MLSFGVGPADKQDVQLSPRSVSPPRVLVIEDDGDVSALLASHLRRLGCEVVEVAAGEAAVRSALVDPPDVVVVDMVLPGIDGREVIEALRADERTRGCAVVVTSVLDAADLGTLSCDALLPKPFTRGDVARAVASLPDRLPVR